jgi:hypothetical protein
MPEKMNEPSLWQVLDRERITRLAGQATPERDPNNAHPIFAKAVTSSPDPEKRFLEIAAQLVKGSDTECRRQATALAKAFGADLHLLVGYLKFKGIIRKGFPVDASPDRQKQP